MRINFLHQIDNVVNVRLGASYPEETLLKVINQLGRVVLLKTLTEGEISFRLDFSDDAFKSGIYLVRVFAN